MTYDPSLKEDIGRQGTKMSVSGGIHHLHFKYSVATTTTIQFKMVSMCWVKSICAPSRLSDVSPKLPLKWSQCSSD